MRARVLIPLILCAVSLPARADDWPQFRGPGGTGVSSEAKLPSAWDKSKNVEWKVKLPGVENAWSNVGNQRTTVKGAQSERAVTLSYSGFSGRGTQTAGGPANLVVRFPTELRKERVKVLLKELDLF